MALIREIPRSLHSQGTGDVAQRQTELLAQGAATRDPATIPPRLPSAAGPATAARVSAGAFSRSAARSLPRRPSCAAGPSTDGPTAPQRPRSVRLFKNGLAAPVVCQECCTRLRGDRWIIDSKQTWPCPCWKER